MAGFEFDVSADFKEIDKMLSSLPGAANKAAVRALNKTVKSAEVAAVRSLANDIGVTQKEVRTHVVMYRARNNYLRAGIFATGKRIPIIDLKARQIGKRKKLRDNYGRYKARRSTSLNAGVKYKGHGGKWRTIPGAFIATMKNGHVGVFKRRGVSRLKIDEKFGPSIPHVFMKRASIVLMKNVTADRWRKNMDHEVWFELNKRGFT